ncbi:metal-dependent membrane protease [Corynebacterium kutscheri]|uniref:CAAX protease self-immunity n=1 Tax=Corynebacterium kutscheri TaxID=35755 RepID=A0A0F6R171_9CORY|nr:CPBP family intramembrane glutamic endopeptidase [Corynebacterium kutscheri]AKE42152.1 CAAX protease self-immunity [Corynebacterium kutscheri]VEH05874.1 metal-dependent membrane protease [Corynebacterium kutscheri]VEH10495.1 metal-dependent membrane protease [Corynebacterium kutscheri]VEH81766.1 metal-dependent membrane protease [Corynebacterium kutscheri]
MSSTFLFPPGSTRNRLLCEIAIVLTITFGISGLRSLFRLIDALLSPQPINEQSVAITTSQADHSWIDLALQLSSAAVLFGWGFLALYLLSAPLLFTTKNSVSKEESSHHLLAPILRFFAAKDLLQGGALAALIGFPGLLLYVAAIKFGWSKQVIPTTFDHLWWEIPVILLWSAANAFAEEVVVVMWFITRLRQLGNSVPVAIMYSAILRGSYHLYQGASAGLGNLIMGLIFGFFFYKTGRIWPLIIGHLAIDVVAFIGYALLDGNLSFLGI